MHRKPSAKVASIGVTRTHLAVDAGLGTSRRHQAVTPPTHHRHTRESGEQRGTTVNGALTKRGKRTGNIVY